MFDIKIEKNMNPKKSPNSDALGFGSVFTDHMFLMKYNEELGWHEPSIVPYGPVMMEPSYMVLHYGQETFEGMKAYLGPNNEALLFRPKMNAKRLNTSNKRLCIPEIPEELFLRGISELVKLDKKWIPSEPGTSLYIRPFVYATDPSLMVYPSSTYMFIVILSPVGTYYKEGINPVKIYVETKYVRAAVGGVGFVKTGGNYGASLLAQEEAKKKGYSQVLWLDSKEHKYIEEVGTMNVFFVINNVLVTPELSGSILPGVTRDSVITIANAMGIKVVERKITIDELIDASKNGSLSEAFGTGTAAVISPIGELSYKDTSIVINDNCIGKWSRKMYDTITGIQTGQIDDKFGYKVVIE